MQTFTTEELERHPADVQHAALVETTFITFEGRPRLVMMSLDEFDRLRGRRHQVLHAATLSDGLLSDIQTIANEGAADGEAARTSPPPG